MFSTLKDIFYRCPCCKKRGKTIDLGVVLVGEALDSYRYCIECGSRIYPNGSYTNVRYEVIIEVLRNLYAKTK